MLLDFNLSQDCRAARGVCGGTLPYMPPEYLEIVAGRLQEMENSGFDPSPDIYSFGALLYELLTGANRVVLPKSINDPVTAAEVLLDRLKDPITPIRSRNGFVSQRLDSLISRCLAPEPGERPPSMAEVKRHLKAESRSFSALTRLAQSVRLYLRRLRCYP